MYRYTVKCNFAEDDPVLIERWLSWLKDPHVGDVIESGASGAEIVRMAGDQPTFEIRYRFRSQEIFQKYLSEHASRLRDDGLARFPLKLGLQYERTDGEVIFECGE